MALSTLGEEMRTFLLAFTIFWAATAGAWGERGHNVIGQVAAKIVKNKTKDDDKKIGRFFFDRHLAFGHLANIPDISWRRPIRMDVTKAEAPTHYIDPEVLLGVPGKNIDEFTKKIRQINVSYEALKKTYDGKVNNLPEKQKKNQRIFVFRDFGGAPWRAQQFFNLAVAAFTCAKEKEKAVAGEGESKSKLKQEPFGENFIHNEFNVHQTLEYKCVKDGPRKKDLYDAWMFLGVMGHYMGDQTQPLHSSSNYDGWYTGHGGLHAYFESDVLQQLDETLQADVLKRAGQEAFQKKIWSEMKVDWQNDHAVTQLVLNIAANSYKQIAVIEDIDSKVAVTQKGSVFPWGEDGRSYDGHTREKAVRKEAKNPAVMKAFRPVIVERLAIAAYLLSEAWYQAWKKGGEPSVADIDPYALPYPLDVPYVWPDFESQEKAIGQGA